MATKKFLTSIRAIGMEEGNTMSQKILVFLNHKFNQINSLEHLIRSVLAECKAFVYQNEISFQ